MFVTNAVSADASTHPHFTVTGLSWLLAINDTISGAVTEAVTNAIARVVVDTITTVINAMVLVAANIHTFQPMLVRMTRGQFRYCAVQST